LKFELLLFVRFPSIFDLALCSGHPDLAILAGKPTRSFLRLPAILFAIPFANPES
jgi:hypothetical protein